MTDRATREELSMSRTMCPLIVVLLILAGQGRADDSLPDRDGDGIRDDHEEVLGTDPGHAESLRVVLDDGPEAESRRRSDDYDATKDFTKIEFCHVGGDRYLWRATFAAAPRLDDTVFHLYVDADADASTGRQGREGASSTGTEYMLSVVGGRGSSRLFDPSGKQTNGPPVTHVVDGNTLLISADIELGRDDRGARFALYVLCHNIPPPGSNAEMSKASKKRVVENVPLSDREKIVRPADHTTNYRVEATFGNHLLQQIETDPANFVVPHDKLELHGFAIDHSTQRRWPHVKLTTSGGTVVARAPRAGRFHIGFMMYDDSRDERVGLYVDDALKGVAMANVDNNTTWLYWLEQPLELTAGERVELRALGSGGKHGICNVLFLPQPPERREVANAVKHLTSACLAQTPDRVTVSWTTSWPCSTKFEYGVDDSYGETAELDGNCLVHRVVLEGLDPQREYHGRAVGQARDGTEYVSEDFLFRAVPPRSPATRTDTNEVPLAVRNPLDVALDNWPVTSGVPFPQGQLGSSDHVRLLAGDTEIPAQIETTARWPDGSIKWLLVTLAADVEARETGQYRLQYGSRVRRADVTQGLSISEQDGEVRIETGVMQFTIDRAGNLAELQRDGRSLLRKDSVCASHATDSDAATYNTLGSRANMVVEERGPLRVVVKVTSWLTGEGGERLMRIEKRIMAYRGAAFLRVEHTFVMDQPQKFTNLEKLAYRVPIPAMQTTWRVPTVGGSELTLQPADSSAWQRFDREFVTVVDGKETPRPGRIVGSIVADQPDGAAVAVRDFWQNYPKGFSVAADGVDIDLCPDFEAGQYDQFPFEKEGHQLYYYLLDGRYRLKRGMSKTHSLLLCFDDQSKRESVCAAFQKPLLATAPASWYCDSKVFYDVAPRDTAKFTLYEEAIDNNLAAYAEQRERQHDFGMLNYGDWYGERGTNWGNVEYDTPHAFFLEYIRSGNPDAFFLGEAAELHNRDIDTIQASEDPHEIGAVYIHQMCHVGEYYDRTVPGSLGIPRGGYTVSHAWTEGHFDHYFLTGDRRSFETGRAVADFFTRKELGRPYDFASCRTPGWHLIMLAATYAATDDPYYLNAARVVIDRVLETQDTQPRPLPEYQQAGRQAFQRGGWSRMMVPGHCQCEPRHRGNAGFMVAVLLAGMKYYHDVTGDPEVKEAIIRGAHYLLDETYSNEVRGFRYTSCPNTNYRPGASPLMVEGIARAYLWTGDERFGRMLRESLPVAAGGSSYGKGFSMYYRMAPRVLADLDAAGIRLNAAP